MISRYESPIVDLVVRGMVPFIQLFALYVIMHGHYSPGGGFQGGAILAASVLLMRLTLGGEDSRRRFSQAQATSQGAVGVLIYAGVGLVSLGTGGMYLDYGSLPFPGVETAMLRSYGILAVEVGVALAVSGILVSIFDDLIGKEM